MAPYGCFLPDLTRFEGAGPPGHGRPPGDAGARRGEPSPPRSRVQRKPRTSARARRGGAGLLRERDGGSRDGVGGRDGGPAGRSRNGGLAEERQGTRVTGPILDIFYVRSGMTRQMNVSTKAAAQVTAHLSKVAYFGVLVANPGGRDLEQWLIMAFAACFAVLGPPCRAASLIACRTSSSITGPDG